MSDRLGRLNKILDNLIRGERYQGRNSVMKYMDKKLIDGSPTGKPKENCHAIY